ncbi:Hypothetical protein PHPALM_6451 [Phytophthora palmivora]|uniref:SWIM-type domain-containing protein n=1 Tax=Phytophthora palmivora TaxID=4796 RepID=A0A2P4YES0_9STRA|nr:Hypothetical protein PHPALM_6451 [Phytophthora palmivora]
MTDADNAQFNACSSQLPDSKILMSWFHIIAYNTPPGCATTNNPVEQYHRKRKLVKKSPKATPSEILQRLDKSRLVFIHMQAKFSSTPIVSELLKTLYKLAGQQLTCPYNFKLFSTSHETIFEKMNLLTAFIPMILNSIRCQNMPEEGWVVIARSKTCGCRFNRKFAMCIHVIQATRELGLPCPGMPDPTLTFVSNQNQRTTTVPRSYHC